MPASKDVGFTVRSLQECTEKTHMHIRLFCAFYLRKFSTNRDEICDGIALNTLEKIPYDPSNRIYPVYEVCIEHYLFFAALSPKEKIALYVKY
jgi:hypothetical protein